MTLRRFAKMKSTPPSTHMRNNEIHSRHCLVEQQAYQFRSCVSTFSKSQSKSVCSKNLVTGEARELGGITQPHKQSSTAGAKTTTVTLPLLQLSSTATRIQFGRTLRQSGPSYWRRFMINVVTCILLCLTKVPLQSETHGLSMTLDDFGPDNSPWSNRPTQNELVTAPPFIEPEGCQWKETNRAPTEVEQLIMTMKCDVRPLVGTLLELLSKFTKPSRKLNSAADVNRAFGNEGSMIWNEFFNIMDRANLLYDEAFYVLKRQEFCTFSTITRLKNIRAYLLGSSVLMDIYEAMSIQFHQNCLVQTLEKLPKIPQLVRDVVTTYIEGDDMYMTDWLEGRAEPLNKLGYVRDDESGFDLNRAIAKVGPLSKVVRLNMDLNLSSDLLHSEERFRIACRSFLVEFEDRWQSMEMMNMMISNEINGIKRYNNYILRMLNLTKYADICSRL